MKKIRAVLAWILANRKRKIIAVLVIVSLAIFLLRGQGETLIDKIKGLFGGV